MGKRALRVILGSFLVGIMLATGAAQPIATAATTTGNQALQTTISLSDYKQASAKQLAAWVRSGKVTSHQLVTLALDKVKQDNPNLNAVLTTRPEKAYAEADTLKDTGQPFYGVPILIKGLAQELKGEPATQGLPYSSDRVASFTRPFVKKLQALGFIVIGQTNYPEMGLINVTNSILYGAAKNPWNLADNPGGSSGGAAAAVADDMVPIATGNDNGGSIRIPAAWSGLIGLKPSSGMITGDGATSSTANFAETKTMADTEALFDGLVADASKSTGVPKDLKQVPIAYSTKSPVDTPVSAEAAQAVEKTVNFLKQQSFTVKQVDSPVDGKSLMQAYFTFATSSGFAANSFAKAKFHRNLQVNDGGIMTYALYEASKKLIATDVTNAKDVVAKAQTQMADFHKTYPLYLTPTVATTAPSNEDPAFLPEYQEKLKTIGSLNSSDQMKLIYDAWLHGLTKTPFTQLANLTGEPAISLPTFVASNGMPLGVQFEADRNQDRLLMKLGDLFEQQHQLKFLHQQQISEMVPPLISTPKPLVVKPSTPEMPTVSSKYPTYVYAKRTLNVYREPAFAHRVKHYQKRSRAKAPHFKVLGIAHDQNDRRRYRIKGGYITGNSKYVSDLYYRHTTKRIRVISRGIYDYQHWKFNQHERKHFYHKGRVLRVKRVVKVGKIIRFELTNGRFVTANKQFVMV